MTFAEIASWVAMAKDTAVGGAAALAAYFAYLGLNAWRKELKGKAEYQLAKEVLKSAYKVREAFKVVRNPMMFSYEYPEDLRDQQGRLEREQLHEGTKYAYEKRWEHIIEAFNQLENHHLEAQVEWGPEFQNRIVKLRNCRSDLLIAIQQLLERKKNPRDAPKLSAEEWAEEQSVLYHLGAGSKHDTFTPKIDDAIEEFEEWLRPHVGRGH